jgi:hypothetical protein
MLRLGNEIRIPSPSEVRASFLKWFPAGQPLILVSTFATLSPEGFRGIPPHQSKALDEQSSAT